MGAESDPQTKPNKTSHHRIMRQYSSQSLNTHTPTHTNRVHVFTYKQKHEYKEQNGYHYLLYIYTKLFYITHRFGLIIHKQHYLMGSCSVLKVKLLVLHHLWSKGE